MQVPPSQQVKVVVASLLEETPKLELYPKGFDGYILQEFQYGDNIVQTTTNKITKLLNNRLGSCFSYGGINH